MTKLPVIPKKPPVCSRPPTMRFCRNVGYNVYRPSIDHTFADLDFDSHAVSSVAVSSFPLALPGVETLVLDTFGAGAEVGIARVWVGGVSRDQQHSPTAC